MSERESTSPNAGTREATLESGSQSELDYLRLLKLYYSDLDKIFDDRPTKKMQQELIEIEKVHQMEQESTFKRQQIEQELAFKKQQMQEESATEIQQIEQKLATKIQQMEVDLPHVSRDLEGTRAKLKSVNNSIQYKKNWMKRALVKYSGSLGVTISSCFLISFFDNSGLISTEQVPILWAVVAVGVELFSFLVFDASLLQLARCPLEISRLESELPPIRWKIAALEKSREIVLNQLSEQESIRKSITFEEENLAKRIADFDKATLERITQYEQAQKERIADIADYRKVVLERISKWENQRLEKLQQKQSQLDTLRTQLDELNSDTPCLLSTSWNDSRWDATHPRGYSPQKKGFPPGVVRIGGIQKVQQAGSYLADISWEKTIPALIPMRTLPGEGMPGHIAIFSSDATRREAALGFLQSIAFRAIATSPVKKVRCTFIDPVSMGSTFPFRNLDRFIYGQKVYTRSEDVREQLRNLTEHIEQVIQNFLGSSYSNLEEYNQANAFVEEAYRYLFIADFPAAFDNNSWEDLKSILVNGAKAGVYVMLHFDWSLEKPRNFDYQLLESYCTVLRSHNGDRRLFEVALFQGLRLVVELDEAPPQALLDRLIDEITQATKQIKVDTIPFQELYPRKVLPEVPEWSSAYDSRSEIRVPIGMMGARDYLEFWLGQNDEGLVVSQALLAGSPGQGKSYTLHAIITGLAMRYAPDELEMYLLDFKEGVEFQMYIDPDRAEDTNPNQELNEQKALPHAKVISIESDREFGASVLKFVQDEIERRGVKFKEAGVSNLREYRNKKTEQKMPRILVVIDEFQYMFRENDAITRELNLIFEDITRRGRAFGVHLLISSQSPNVQNMSRGIYSFIELRMALKMDSSTAASILAEGNVDAVELLERPGQLIYNREFGRRNYNEIGQVADANAKARVEALLQVDAIANARNYQRPEPLIIFNGARATRLRDNRQLLQLSQMDRWLSFKELNQQVVKESDWFPQEMPGVAWLGEAMRIGNHTRAIFRKRARCNMLLVGTSEETIMGIIGGILLSLVHSYEPQQAQFDLVDLSQPEESWSDMSLHFRDTFAPYFDIALGKRFPAPEQQVLRAETLLEQTYAEFDRRKQQQEADPDAFHFGASRFLVCAIGGINRAPKLRPVMGRSREEPSEDAQKLYRLATEGAELGIHLILWLDSMKTFAQLSGESRTWLTPFDLRVGLTMPGDDSRTLLGEVYAQTLPRLRAYFSDRATGSDLEKFKPYAVPSQQEIAHYGDRFQQRFQQRSQMR